MAQDTQYLNKEFWVANIQMVLFKESAALEVASVDLRDILAGGGDKINFPWQSPPQDVSYTKGGSITNKNINSGVDYMDIATARVVPVYLDDIDRLQSNWDIQTTQSMRAGRLLNNRLDQLVNYNGYTYASDYIDAGDVGGSAGSNISLSVSNIDQAAVGLDTILNTVDAPQAGRFIMAGPRFKAVLNRFIGGKETAMGDVIGQNGRMPDRFGFELYYSNNNYFTATWTPANAPSAAQTLTINGAVLEFVAVPDSGEASVAYIGVDVNATLGTAIDNLVAAINDTVASEGTAYGTTDAGNCQARWKLNKAGVVATNSSDTAMTIVAYGDIVLATSDANDPWSAQTSYLLAGVKKSVKIAWQKKPTLDVRRANAKLGDDIYVWTLYGSTVPTDMKDLLVTARLDASSWT